MDEAARSAEGMKTYHEARRFDEVAVTREDRVCVEESYWAAYRLLEGSTDPEHQRIHGTIRQRLAEFLRAEGREDAARELLRGFS